MRESQKRDAQETHTKFTRAGGSPEHPGGVDSRDFKVPKCILHTRMLVKHNPMDEKKPNKKRTTYNITFLRQFFYFLASGLSNVLFKSTTHITAATLEGFDYTQKKE